MLFVTRRAGFIPFLLLLLAGCATARAVQHDGPMTFRVVESGSYGRAAEGERKPAALFVAGDETAYRNLWAAHVGASTPPAVDFAREAAIFLVGAQHTTGGFELEVRGVRSEAGTIVVDAPLHGPKAKQIVSQAITAPYAVIAIDRAATGAVRWIDASGHDIATAPAP